MLGKGKSMGEWKEMQGILKERGSWRLQLDWRAGESHGHEFN